jgi:transposase
VEARLDAIAASDGRVSLILTVPGVGPRTAEGVAVHLVDAGRFRRTEEVGAYAGLVPRQYQSGETDRRGRITRHGPKLLRAALVGCAWCSLRSDSLLSLTLSVTDAAPGVACDPGGRGSTP